jgi:hypothetical protein
MDVKSLFWQASTVVGAIVIAKYAYDKLMKKPDLSGLHLNGVHLNGVHLNGAHKMGLHLNGLAMK